LGRNLSFAGISLKESTTAACVPGRTSPSANLGDRAQNLQRAVTELSRAGSLGPQSSLYETEPVQVTAQPWFLNCVVALDTQLPPPELLSAALALEKDMGRMRSQAKGARVIDVDIILYGDLIVETPGLTIPHPAMQERRYVLEPSLKSRPTLHTPCCATPCASSWLPFRRVRLFGEFQKTNTKKKRGRTDDSVLRFLAQLAAFCQ
jgi:2-amino-4-hydroxy-6-hydroxymethyldihydropteridine diphosphokinase